jgi:hypothetical protein
MSCRVEGETDDDADGFIKSLNEGRMLAALLERPTKAIQSESQRFEVPRGLHERKSDFDKPLPKRPATFSPQSLEHVLKDMKCSETFSISFQAFMGTFVTSQPQSTVKILQV